MLMLLLMSLALGLLLPLYTDEVGWRFQLSRYFQDGGVDRFLVETCGANTNAVPPFFMLPVRFFSSALTALFSDPLIVRLSGVAFAILGVFGLRAVVWRAIDDPRRRALIDILCLALLGMGVLPLLLVWSRPEQPVWLAVLASVLVALRQRAAADREPIAPIAVILLLAVMAMSYHLKALIYLPLFALALVLSGKNSRHLVVRGAALVLLVGMAWLAFRYWSARFACPGDPVVAEIVAGQNVSVLLLGDDWKSILSQLPQILSGMLPTEYLRVALPMNKYMSDWMPPGVTPRELTHAWKALGHVAWGAGLATGLGALILALRTPERRWTPLLLAFALIGCATIWAGLQLTKNAYESALYLPVLVLALALALAALPREPRWLMPAIWGVAALSCVSQVLLIGYYGARLWASEPTAGYVADQPYSMSVYGYSALRTRIAEAGAKCGIATGRESRRVLIDDVTYFTFAQSYRPAHRLGVLSVWNGSLKNPLAWMHMVGSSGAVLRCDYLPADMRAKAIATGPFCCIKKQ